jgi:hypothetical protein
MITNPLGGSRKDSPLLVPDRRVEDRWPVGRLLAECERRGLLKAVRDGA